MELWIKALHVMAVMAWMAGLFYLPRLFVYHTQAATGSAQSETFKTMEVKLLKIIMGPAMLVTWLTGLYLAWAQQQYTDGWFVVKLVLVIAMTMFHVKLSMWRKAFASDVNVNSERFYRLANEIPTVLMAGIVIMVIVKPL
ncbi:MAG: protoporphyrinogen oxidase HemJ [Pseudomonadota bacterium]